MSTIQDSGASELSKACTDLEKCISSTKGRMREKSVWSFSSSARSDSSLDEVRGAIKRVNEAAMKLTDSLQLIGGKQWKSLGKPVKEAIQKCKGVKQMLESMKEELSLRESPEEPTLLQGVSGWIWGTQVKELGAVVDVDVHKELDRSSGQFFS